MFHRFFNDPYFTELERLRRGMDAIFQNAPTGAYGSDAPVWRRARIFPLLNVREVDHSYVVTAEIPGMKTDDLDIKVEGNTLAIKGERKPENVDESLSFHRRERATGTFQRSLTLPNRIDSEKVTANYNNGALTITLPIEEAARPRQIQVKS
jgi:HSP20 family protein